MFCIKGVDGTETKIPMAEGSDVKLQLGPLSNFFSVVGGKAVFVPKKGSLQTAQYVLVDQRTYNTEHEQLKISIRRNSTACDPEQRGQSAARIEKD